MPDGALRTLEDLMKTFIAMMAAGALTAAAAATALAQSEPREETVVDTEWEEYGRWFDDSRPDNWFALYDTNEDGLIDEEVFERQNLAKRDVDPNGPEAGAEADDDFLWGLFGLTD